MLFTILTDSLKVDRVLAFRDKFGRSDILERSHELIALQNRELLPSDADDLTREEDAVRQELEPFVSALAPSAGFNPAWEGLPMGARLPNLVFSPLCQREFYVGPSRNAMNRAYEIPSTAKQIEGYFRTTTYISDIGDDLCRRAWNFDLKQYAKFLCEVRTLSPALYVLIMSREYELAVAFHDSLPPALKLEIHAALKKFMPRLQCGLETAVAVPGEAQRLAQLLLALLPLQALRPGLLRSVSGTDAPSGVDPPLTAIELSYIQYVATSTFALRELFMNRCYTRNGRKQLRNEMRSVATAAVHDELTKNPPTCRTAADAEQSRVTKAQQLASATVERISGSGGTRGYTLAAFYGLVIREIALAFFASSAEACRGNFVMYVVNMLASQVIDKLEEAPRRAADEMAKPTDPELPLGEDCLPICSRDTAAWRQRLKCMFPQKGEFGHSAGFNVHSWYHPEEDAQDWELLSTSTGSSDSTAALAITCRDYLKAFSYKLVRPRPANQGARVFCYLAQSFGSLSLDPIWIRLQERQRMLREIRLYDPARVAKRRGTGGTRRRAQVRKQRCVTPRKDQITGSIRSIHDLLRHLVPPVQMPD